VSKNQLNRTSIPKLGDSDQGCNILHLDMDAFYASVEVKRNPNLKGKPVIVGGNSGRGVVVAATYEARAFGIHAAMPMSRAIRLCPEVIVVSPDHQEYAETSEQLLEIMLSVTPLVETISLDEAFLDVTGSRKLLGTPRAIGDLLRSKIKNELQLTASVGIASTKFVAKLASTYAKPDGLLVVPVDQVLEFLHPLPVNALWGVGSKTEEKLVELGLKKISDIAQLPVKTLIKILGEAAGEHLHDLAWGRDEREVVVYEPDKSIGHEHTFDVDVFKPTEIEAEILRLSDLVASRLRSRELVGRTISVKLRFNDFSTITRSQTIKGYTNTTQEINSIAKGLYQKLGLQRARIRLVGVRVEGLHSSVGAAIQPALDAPEHGWPQADQAIDKARERFGDQAVKPARLVSQSDDLQE
jgi:DNA polymerase IV